MISVQGRLRQFVAAPTLQATVETRTARIPHRTIETQDWKAAASQL